MPAIRKPKDFLSGAFFMAVGLAAIGLAQGYTIGTASRMGSGYFAALMGLILCAFAVILIVRSFFGRPEPLPGCCAGRCSCSSRRCFMRCCCARSD